MQLFTLDESLQAEHQALIERVQMRRAELEPIARRLDAIAGELVDTDDPAERQVLVDELIVLEAERRVFLAEIGVLQQRKRAAYVVLYVEAEERTRKAYEASRTRSNKLRAKANELTKQAGAAQNGRIPQEMLGDQNAIDVYRAELAGKKTRAWALSHTAARDHRRALDVWRQAKEALETAQGEAASVIPFPGPVAA